MQFLAAVWAFLVRVWPGLEPIVQGFLIRDYLSKVAKAKDAKNDLREAEHTLEVVESLRDMPIDDKRERLRELAEKSRPGSGK